MEKAPPLVAHIIYRLGVGGLENGLVNLINRMPAKRYRHAVICLKDADDFQRRIKRQDVEVFQLYKQEGHDFGLFWRLFKLLKKLKPSIVHTRNLAAIECQLPAFLAGVPIRVHGEHGWDSFDPHGENRKYQWLRRLFKPFVQRYIPLSGELERYLTEKAGVNRAIIRRICNGVDQEKFQPRQIEAPLPDQFPWKPGVDLIVGTIGRMHGVKDQVTLAKAAVSLLKRRPDLSGQIKFAMVGDGPLREVCRQLFVENDLESSLWLPGERSDIEKLLPCFDLFVLPSQAEGISNTILEAMACELSVIATDTGGNPDLVENGATGLLVPVGDSDAISQGLEHYIDHPELRREHGKNGQQRVIDHFNLEKMVEQYQSVYDELFMEKGLNGNKE